MISFLVRDFCRSTIYQPLFVVDRSCACLCRQVYKGFALFYVDICAFPFVFLCFMLWRYRQVDRFHGFLCRQVLRLFMSTGLRFCAFLCRYLRFPCLHVERFMQLWSNVFSMWRDIQSYPDVYSILMYILWLAKWYSILITYFTRIINRAWTLQLQVHNYIWQIHTKKSEKNNK